MQLIYFSPVAWDGYEQRPHYAARHFLALGGRRVVWVNPYPARLPQWTDLARLTRPAASLRLDRPAGLSVVDLSAWPIDPLPGGAWLNHRVFWRRALDELGTHASRRDTVLGVGRPTALALAALGTIDRAWSFYDAMDQFPEFYRGLSRRATRGHEASIAARVDQIFASSTALADKFAPVGRRVTLMRNAYDMALLPPPAEPGRTGLRLGFVGCMGHWLDWSMVWRIADTVSPMPVTMVGPRRAPLPRGVPANIEWRPECHQTDAVAHLQTFSAGLIPFTRDRLTAAIDPIKYYQYRGAGLPVLSTRFGDMETRSEADATFFLDDAGGPRSAIDAALAWRPSPGAIATFRAANTWTHRFEAAHLFSPR